MTEGQSLEACLSDIMRDLVGQEMLNYLCFKAGQVPVQVLHEAIKPAVCLAVTAALHLHSALRTCRLTANIHHILSATASCSELETDPGLVTKPSAGNASFNVR